MLNVFTRSFIVVVFVSVCCCRCCCCSFATFSFQLLLSSLGFCLVVVAAAAVSVFDMRVDEVGQAIRIKYPKKLEYIISVSLTNCVLDL